LWPDCGRGHALGAWLPCEMSAGVLAQPGALSGHRHTAITPPSPTPRRLNMAREQIKAEWQTIDVDTLPEAQKKAYDAYKDAYRIMKAMRENFENDMAELAKPPVGQRLVFGYNFGKLSVALVPDDRKPAAKSAPQSLSAFLASTSASGRRV
jgi:hypothetical protein